MTLIIVLLVQLALFPLTISSWHSTQQQPGYFIAHHLIEFRHGFIPRASSHMYRVYKVYRLTRVNLRRLGRSNTGPSQQQQQQPSTSVPLGGGARRKSPTTPTGQAAYGGYEAQQQQQQQEGTAGSYSQASTRPLYLCQPCVVMRSIHPRGYK